MFEIRHKCLMVSQSAEMHSSKYCMWLSFYFQVLSQFEILNNYEIRKIYKVHTSLKWARALLSSEVSSPNLSYPLNKTPKNKVESNFNILQCTYMQFQQRVHSSFLKHRVSKQMVHVHENVFQCFLTYYGLPNCVPQSPR